jgi:hypothetical protein
MYPIQSLAGVVVAIERHRRQTARLLDGLDDIDRAAVSDGAPAPAPRRTDVSTLVSHLAGHLRLTDIRLRRLADELDGRDAFEPVAPSPRGEPTCSCASTLSVTSIGSPRP